MPSGLPTPLRRRRGGLGMQVLIAGAGRTVPLMVAEPMTWHHGLMARWWTEFNRPADGDDPELAFYRAMVIAGNGPALDVGCGTGRILIPLVQEGLAVDGTDISADMVDGCREIASGLGLHPHLQVQAANDLDMGRTYRTIYLCGAFGIGGNRAHDR